MEHARHFNHSPDNKYCFFCFFSETILCIQKFSEYRDRGLCRIETEVCKVILSILASKAYSILSRLLCAGAAARLSQVCLSQGCLGLVAQAWTSARVLGADALSSAATPGVPRKWCLPKAEQRMHGWLHVAGLGSGTSRFSSAKPPRPP
jgi:hypothetical protein